MRTIQVHWIALYAKCNIVTCFNGFGVEQIPKDIKNFIGNKNITFCFEIQPYN